MFPTRATQTLTIGKRRLRDLKFQREWKTSDSIFCVKDGIKYASELIPANSYPRSNRLFSNTAKEIRKSGRSIRKKKPLVQSNPKTTTKDRLRLATQSSASTKKSQNKDGDDRMIQSPEELMERLNTGLGIARNVVKEGYATLRNPKAGDKQGNHLLSARPTPGSSKGSRPAPPEGLVMDANWWFWNLLFAASPAILIAVYCEFIIKPEMKVRHDEKSLEEKEKNEPSQGNEPGSTSHGGSSDKKVSSMRMRQEEQQQKKKKLPENQLAPSQASPTPSTVRNNPNDMVTSYSRFLVSLFSGEQAQPIVSAPEHGQSHKNETKDVETNDIKPAITINQTQPQDKELSLEMQQQELNELQLQLQRLQDNIIRQQRERADSNAGTDSDVSNDTSKLGSLSSIGTFAKGTTTAGLSIAKERFGSLLIWWQQGQASEDRRKRKIVSTDDETQTEKSNDSAARVSGEN